MPLCEVEKAFIDRNQKENKKQFGRMKLPSPRLAVFEASRTPEGRSIEWMVGTGGER